MNLNMNKIPILPENKEKSLYYILYFFMNFMSH